MKPPFCGNRAARTLHAASGDTGADFARTAAGNDNPGTRRAQLRGQRHVDRPPPATGSALPGDPAIVVEVPAMTRMPGQRQRRFHALHALLTGEALPAPRDLPRTARLRRDLGLPEAEDPLRPSAFDPNAFASRGHR